MLKTTKALFWLHRYFVGSVILSLPIFFADILSAAIFCRRGYFLESAIWSSRIFFLCWYFVERDILLTSIFCRKWYFFFADFFSSLIFCWQQYFVESDILASPIFFLRQYFVGSDILSSSIFCQKQYFGVTDIFSCRVVYNNYLDRSIEFWDYTDPAHPLIILESVVLWKHLEPKIRGGRPPLPLPPSTYPTPPSTYPPPYPNPIQPPPHPHSSSQSLCSRALIFKCLWGPGIDSKEWIPPAYEARLNMLAEFIHWNRFLGSINV
jgi:hypothetical protein